MKECELCDSWEWHPGAKAPSPVPQEPSVGLDAEAEALVKVITEQILAKIK
jgi:hypothetical protein